MLFAVLPHWLKHILLRVISGGGFHIYVTSPFICILFATLVALGRNCAKSSQLSDLSALATVSGINPAKDF